MPKIPVQLTEDAVKGVAGAFGRKAETLSAEEIARASLQKVEDVIAAARATGDKVAEDRITREKDKIWSLYESGKFEDAASTANGVVEKAGAGLPQTGTLQALSSDAQEQMGQKLQGTPSWSVPLQESSQGALPKPPNFPGSGEGSTLDYLASAGKGALGVGLAGATVYGAGGASANTQNQNGLYPDEQRQYDEFERRGPSDLSPSDFSHYFQLMNRVKGARKQPAPQGTSTPNPTPNPVSPTGTPAQPATGTAAVAPTGTTSPVMGDYKFNRDNINNVVNSFTKLNEAYTKLPENVRNQFSTSYDKINTEMEALNSAYERKQAEAKDKAERDTNRAEWASIASMLAKNVAGFAAALHGVPAEAMAYQTEDWGKRVDSINKQLDANLLGIRDELKQRMSPVKDKYSLLQQQEQESLKSQLAGLGEKASQYRDQLGKEYGVEEEKMREYEARRRQQEELQSRATLASAKGGDTETITEIPVNTKAILDSSKDSKGNIDISKLGAQLTALEGVDKEKVKSIVDQYSRIPLVGPSKKDTVDRLVNELSGLTQTKRTVKQRVGGQPTQPMVHSGTTISTKGEYDALPSGATFIWNGQQGKKP